MEIMRLRTKTPMGMWMKRALYAAAALVLAGGTAALAQSAPPNGVEATSLALDRPHGVAYDTAGNVYIADTDEHVIRKVNASGIITTVAGDGEQGYGGDGGLATAAVLDSPAGVAVDASGNIYIADTHNNVIREVLASTGKIATIAGTGVAGFSGDGTAATALLNYPTAVAVDSNHNIYIADTNNHRIREITGTTINTVAGEGEQFYLGDGVRATGAGLDSPSGVAVDAAFNIYIGDTHNQRVRMVTHSTGEISTLAGTGEKGFTGDGLAASAALARPRGVAVDTTGDVYFADSDNQRIRTISSGEVTTIAGSGAEGFGGDGSIASGAWLDTPDAVALWGAKVLISDTRNNRVRQVSSNMIDTIAGLEIASAPATLLSPAPGSVLPGSSAAFSWSVGIGVTEYWLYVGTTGVGSANLYNKSATATSANVTDLPTLGQIVYVRLLSKINGAWQYSDSTYTEATIVLPAAMVTPAPGSTLTGASAAFAWSAGAGVSEYWLYAGSTGAGSSNLYNSFAATTSANVAHLPLYGQTIYVRLLSKINGVWQHNDYTYTEAGTPAAVMISPVSGSTLSGSSVTFTWSKGLNVSEYWLYIGSTGVGSTNIYNRSATTTSASVTNLPVLGQTVYVRLLSKINGVWQSNDYSYTAADNPAPAVMSTPISGSKLPGATATFNWTAGAGVTEYWLYVGTKGAGSTNVYNKAATTTSANVTGLPTNGATVYVRLLSKINGAWQSNDYTYTAQ
jgi:hypothetical protein